MKNFKLFAIVLFTVIAGLSSCKKDDDASASGSITGKWSLKSSVTKTYFAGVLADTDTETGSAGDYYEFKSDNKGVAVTDGDSVSFTYSLTDSNKKLSITFAGEAAEAYDVKTLTSSQLVLYNEETESLMGQTFKYTTEITLTK